MKSSQLIVAFALTVILTARPTLADECKLKTVEIGSNKIDEFLLSDKPQIFEFSNASHGWQLKCASYLTHSLSQKSSGNVVRSALIDCIYPDGQSFQGTTSAVYNNGSLVSGSSQPWSLSIFGKETKKAINPSGGGSFKGALMLSLVCR